MACYAGTDFNDLAKLLFKTLATLNPDFDSSQYLSNFEAAATNVDKVDFVYNDIKKYPKVFAKFIKDTKDDNLALQHCDSGKRKMMAGKFWEALEDFTRMISTAESQRVLALGYGHRSECFLKLKRKEECLQEIERATIGYPRELLDTLTNQKAEAQKLEFTTSSYFESIPQYEKCVEVSGCHVFATKDIEIGDIISVEEPFSSVLTSDRLTHCHECLNLCYNPIPCLNCTVALFCSDSCMERAKNYHKFECPILLTVCYRVLCEFAADSNILLALKIALLAKDYFPASHSLLITQTDALVQLNFLKTEAQFLNLDLFHHAILTGIIFELLWNYTSFFSGIFSSTDNSYKFKEIMFLQLQTTCINAAKIYEYVYKFGFNGTSTFGLGAYSFFSEFEHSCCANVMKSYHGNKLVLRALNTIRSGEECFVNRYGLRYDVSSTLERRQFLLAQKLECNCKACEDHWEANLGDVPQICASLNIELMELGDIVKNVIGSEVGKAKELLSSLIGLLQENEDLEPKGNALALKNLIVHCYVILGNKRIEFDESQSAMLLLP